MILSDDRALGYRREVVTVVTVSSIIYSQMNSRVSLRSRQITKIYM